jgi:hypothetical protein
MSEADRVSLLSMLASWAPGTFDTVAALDTVTGQDRPEATFAMLGHIGPGK